MKLTELPYELLLSIFVYLSSLDVIKIISTCRALQLSWKDIIKTKMAVTWPELSNAKECALLYDILDSDPKIMASNMIKKYHRDSCRFYYMTTILNKYNIHNDLIYPILVQELCARNELVILADNSKWLYIRHLHIIIDNIDLETRIKFLAAYLSNYTAPDKIVYYSNLLVPYHREILVFAKMLKNNEMCAGVMINELSN